jgi:hypothetical protein
VTGAALLLAVAALQLPRADSFPHRAHLRLFTTCAACHAGITTGDSARARPQPQECVSCHDGETQRVVRWAAAPPRPTNLRFDHVSHQRGVTGAGERELACGACHSRGPGGIMDVGTAPPERCLDCHTHRAPSHFAATDCAACHRPLRAANRLAAADIGRFSRPPSHDSNYVFAHGPEATSATCAFCHTRESCASCHVNAGQVEAIRRMDSDARVASLVREREIRYPVPPGHRAAGFTRGHGLEARQGGATCASCHTRESCLTCHRPVERLAAIAALPRQARGGPRGVELAGLVPADHVPGFGTRHRAASLAGDQACSRCHTQSFCASCHDASESPGFHGANFVMRHSAEAMTSELECSSCHQTQAFCRDCHRSTGRASGTGGSGGRYHDNQANWTFAHSAAARRSIEACASCHQQRDCLQCHSARQGWGVNPHGRGFDREMAARNRSLCLRCHVTVP